MASVVTRTSDSCMAGATTVEQSLHTSSQEAHAIRTSFELGGCWCAQKLVAHKCGITCWIPSSSSTR
eukprot:696164-Amphidinium_carterae.1